ncbi:replicative DNA helicase [Sphingobacterium alkalisoli]|uniref:Replicative DNA helicase n=1 Tax=Sphingobacterium alkalisoli TaxID=1874115 RepID=A0A4V5LXW1_9SPHI|nr:replicative DNA helicase [Sphingobacterium alkalisoli]TJY63799.1 replicative DNA helicase [Sphingobacterium alkalisoli]GGH24816.1 replicative DNA helicase [Sphingobacterium alkalisoli]
MIYDKKKHRRDDREPNFLSGGKLPPQAVDLEEAVLGAVLSERDCLMMVSDILHPEMFYKEANQIIYKAVQSISLSGEALDILTVVSRLRKDGDLEKVGGAYYLTSLTDRVVSAANIEFHARIVSQKYMQRELIKVSAETIQNCYDETEDIFDIISLYETKRDELVNNIITRKEVGQEDAFNQMMEEITRQAELGELEVTGVDTGFRDMNAATGGWQKANVIILAARPAMGKTALMLKKATKASRSGKPVAIFSLEMAKEQLQQRILSQETGIPLYKIKSPSKLDDIDWAVIYNKSNEIASLPIFWDDTPGLTLIELNAKAKRLKRLHGIEMIFIDYLQLITIPGEKRFDEISKISRGLKILSKELQIPVLALSQLSRAVESRPGNSKRPQLSDLRESGSIEQDADIVMFLYRAEYYGMTEDEDGRPTAGMAEAIIAKNRDGATDTIDLIFHGPTTNFSDVTGDVMSDFSFMDKQKEIPNNNLNGHASWNGALEDTPF